MNVDQVYVLGFSMGGLVSVQLFKEFQYDGLVFINTPVYYWDVKRIAVNLFHDFGTYFKKYLLASTDKPFNAMIQFLNLLNRTKSLFQDITCPTFVVQTMDDDTVHPRSAEYIYKHLSGKKQIKKYPVGGHVVFLHEQKLNVIEDIGVFLASLKHE